MPKKREEQLALPLGLLQLWINRWILDVYHCLMSTFCPDEGGHLLEACPCLPEFISAVVYNTASDPAVLSFTLKLTGLMAASEDGFRKLQVEFMTLCALCAELLPSISDCGDAPCPCRKALFWTWSSI